MSSIPIDTQEVVDKLTSAGVPQAQAKAHAAVLLESLRPQDASISARMCTKGDLIAALAPLQQAITDLQSATARLDAKIDSTAARLKSELLTWLISLGVFQGGLAIAILLQFLR